MKKSSITIQDEKVFIYLVDIRVLEESETNVKFTGVFSDIEKRSLADHFNIEVLDNCITVSKELIAQLNGTKF